MPPLHARQIKAARAMLGWSREEMATATRLSLTTIRNLEAGTISPRGATYNTIRQTVEENGIEFTDREGVRACVSDLLLFEGPDAKDRFFKDMLQTIRQRGGEVRAACPTQAILEECFGAVENNLDRFEQLAAVARVTCLLWDCRQPLHPLASIQFRAISKLDICPSPYFVYGDKLAFANREGRRDLRFIVIQSVSMARNWSDHFVELWDAAVPFLTHATDKPKKSPGLTLSADETPDAESGSASSAKERK
jgi:transcriptional regulator with XRE-family HTH domain